MILNTGFKITLVLAILYIWLLMYWAHISPYDENYGYAINAMLISLVLTIIITIGLIRKKKFFIHNKLFNVGFLIIGSPLTIFIFVNVFEYFFGQYFKV